MIPLVGKTILDGAFSGETIVSRIGGKPGEVFGITIQLRAPWDYSSCLGAISSDTLDAGAHHRSHLDELFIGLFGSEITLFKINPTNAILECGSIRIEKRLLDAADLIDIADDDHRTAGDLSPFALRKYGDPQQWSEEVP